MKTKATFRRLVGTALALTAAAACSDTTGVPMPTPVSLRFQVTTPGATAVSPGGILAVGPQRVAGPPMVIDGLNGSLTIDEIRIIINQAELKPADGSCDLAEASGEDCPDFEAPPRFLDLPLDGEPIDAFTALIPAGTYKALDFEIEDLEDDETDPTVAAAIDVLRADILSEFPDWPDQASVLVSGSFTPTGSDPVDFRTYLKAEIEVEMALVPNLVIDESGRASRNLTVDVSPHMWFLLDDGSVLPLSDYDYGATQEMLEFDVEMEDGFTQIEVGG